MAIGRPNTLSTLGRSDERVEWALQELATAVAGSAHETQARVALDVLRCAFKRVQASAATDPLTGLANRACFDQVLDAHFAVDSATAANTAALLFLDLDGFKEVNDQRGHRAGDSLLAEVARRIVRSVRDHDLVARHGGDEFVVLLENIENPSIAHAVAARVVEAIAVPFEIEGEKVRLGVSIGVAYYPEHGNSGHELLQRADYAMYRAKNQGGRSYAVFGEREDLIVPRTTHRSWTWELAPVDQDSVAQHELERIVRKTSG
jgi:diguanylate cyclase (GGDEF)-like protein